METPLVEFIKTHPDAQLPKYAHKHDAGADLFSIETTYIEFGQTKGVEVGLSLAYCDPDYEIQVRSRSGLASQGVQISNSPGTIDPDYRGNIKVLLQNLNPNNIYCVQAGDRIAQIVVAPRVRADFGFTEEKSETDRGEGGFGSTGVQEIDT